MKAKHLAGALLTCATSAGLLAAFAPGGDAYTKRFETALLAEPRMLAAPVAHLSYGRKVQVEAVQGAWLRVRDGKNSGWIFAGNLAEEKPSTTTGLDGLPIGASETSASTAARPLRPITEEYSSQRGLGDASADLQWLEQQHASLTPADVMEFLKAQKKGEFQ